MTIGILNLLKPPGMTSHDVVSRVRRKTGIKRVGHAGTLDPEAAGVLPVCVGSATRLIQYLDHRKKIYRAEMQLGVETTTQDLTGEILRTTEYTPDLELIINTLNNFIGEYAQTPPMYSSVKKNGKKLYELAREGKEVERKVKSRFIYSINPVSFNNKKALFDVVCSEGTYIRTLCHDAGKIMGCGAAMSFLLRKESCGLSLEHSQTLEEFEDAKDWTVYCLLPDKPLKHLPAITIDQKQSHRVQNGNPISLNDAKFLQKVKDSNTTEELYYRLYLDNLFVGIGIVKESESLVKFAMKFNSEELK